ncbi:MAG: GNAT family N-acetyltransferase [Alphaproteobacteria bacterium]|nr:GNAT family N-acetyltransferase [Alphaproteobacteria bacterium]
MAGVIRQLGESDAKKLRTIWIEALKAEPEMYEAFCASIEKRPLSHFKKRLTKGAVFGAFRKGKLVGFSALRPVLSPGARHKAEMWGLYLREPLRGKGLAMELIDAIEGFAREKFDVINVRVVDKNRRTRRFLDRVGYKLYGIERRAIRSGGRFFDVELRAKRLL